MSDPPRTTTGQPDASRAAGARAVHLPCVSRADLDGALFRLSPHGQLIVTHPEAVCLDANQALGALLGRTPAELVGQPIAALGLFLDGRDGEALLCRAAAGPITVEARVVQAGGVELPALCTGIPVVADGRPAILVSIQDISPWQKCQEAHRLDEQRLEALLKLNQMTGAPLPEIVQFAMEEAVRLTQSRIGYVAFVNEDESVLAIHAWSSAAMAECRVPGMPRVYPLATTGLWGEAVRQRRPVITNDYASDGPWKRGVPEGHVRLHRHLSVPVFDGDRIAIVAGVANKGAEYADSDVRQVTLLMSGMWAIIERARAEGALRASEAQMQSIFRAAPVGIGLVRERILLDVNERICEMIGRSRSQLVGRSTRLLYPTDADFEFVGAEKRRQILDHGSGMVETRWVRSDGTVIDVLLSSMPVGPMLPGGAVTFTALDITERKRVETERLELERQVLHAQKLESLGVLAGGIAHDFNNLLMAIIGNLDLAISVGAMDAPARAHVSEAEAAARRAADLTRQMLAYSGRGRFVVEPTDLSRLVSEMASLLRTSIPRRVRLDMQLGAGLPCVQGDPAQMQQVVLNLITNAAEAIDGEDGAIVLRTEAREVDAAQLERSRIKERREPGRYVCLEVCDNGCGMDDVTQQKLFDPFFTTKETGRGLGMAAVLGIVRDHGGALILDTTPGAGARFTVLLPATEGVAPEAWSPERNVARQSGEATVLLVDDEEPVRMVAHAMLTRLGHTVVQASTADEAVERLREAPHAIDCVLLDLAMPGKDGIAALREMRTLRPDVRVILSSGYNPLEAAHRAGETEVAGVIQKPYRLAELRDELVRVLGG
ncbi:MAG TPA: GAF domain-containing protein [Chthonomonadales bacterium]|nr:GAF domain-containing protein [Chthonomonadales bacterium]